MTVDTPHMNVGETALYMRCSKAHVYRLIEERVLASSKNGSRRTVHVKDADAYLKACRQAATNRVGA